RDDDPVMFFEHKLLYDLQGEVPSGEHVIELGRADVKRPGDKVTVVAMGRMVHLSLQAAETMSGEGVEVEVVDPRTVSPRGEYRLRSSARKPRRLVVADEDTPRCPRAAALVPLVATQAFDALDAPPQTVTAPHTPVPFSPPLEDFYVPTPE